MIKTTKEMRDFYVKHLDKLDDYANGKFEDGTCYMCSAAGSTGGGLPDCWNCPLDDEYLCCETDMRELNLRQLTGKKTWEYRHATPATIKKHIKWMEQRIKEKTDCEFYYD